MTTVVWYDSAEVGAPTLNNAAGSLLAVLQACLVTGFRPLTLDSVVVAGGVATATHMAGHQYSNGRIVEIGGAATSAINGRKRITVTGAGAFTFPAPGVPDGTIGGTITAIRPSLGWSRPLSSGNVAIYQRTDVTATGMMLRVDDSGTGDASATQARWKMIEGYTDLNSVTNQAPPVSSLPGGVYIHKGANNTTAKRWTLVGDSRTFYLLTEQIGNSIASTGGALSGIYGFGDAQRVASGDAFCCFVAGTDAGLTGTSNDLSNARRLSVVPSGNVWWQRPSNGVGLPVRAGMLSYEDRRIGGVGPTYPSPVDNGLVIQQSVLAVEENGTFNHPIRGVWRGIADALAALVNGSAPATVWDRAILSSLVGTDREYLVVPFTQNSSYGAALFDITGPWA